MTRVGLPFVSVIMPIRNEADFIGRSLGAVLAQDYPHELLEVIIADGMSTDNTRAEIERVCSGFPSVRVTIVHNPRGIVPTGMNLALARAKGDCIIRIDGHCIVERDYVQRCIEYLSKRHDVDCVGGPIASVSESPIGQAIALAMSSPFGIGNAYFRYLRREAYVDTVAFGAYRRRVFENIGLFDEELVRNQDDEFDYRLREFGGKILLVPEIKAAYYTRSSFRKLWQQYYGYGFWKVRVIQKHPAQMQLRQFVPPAFVAALLSSLVLIPFTPIGLWLLGLFGGSYVAASLFASILTAHKNSWKSLPLLPVAFATLHLSYGLGFLVGLVKFWNRWGTSQHRPI